jgi:hypothetical protein
MSAAVVPIERLKLVTIIVQNTLWDRLHSDLSALGVERYALTTVDASWSHTDGGALTEKKRIRIETLVGDKVRKAILDVVKRRYAGEGLMAFANDVDGVVL